MSEPGQGVGRCGGRRCPDKLSTFSARIRCAEDGAANPAFKPVPRLVDDAWAVVYRKRNHRYARLRAGQTHPDYRRHDTGAAHLRGCRGERVLGRAGGFALSGRGAERSEGQPEHRRAGGRAVQAFAGRQRGAVHRQREGQHLQ